VKTIDTLPLARIGITLVVGAVVASAFQFYIAFAQEASDLSHDPALDRGGLWRHFTNEFLFSGTIPSILFWVGIGIMGVGIARNAMFSRR
jgi:hypothetical protein